jgi:hypothetical protein
MSMLKRWKYNDYKNRMSEQSKKITNTKEWKKETSERMKKYWDAEQKEKHSNIMKIKWKDPEYKKKCKSEEDIKKFREETIKRNLINNPSKKLINRKKTSRRLKDLWADPNSKFHSDYCQKKFEEGRRKAYNNWLKNSPYVWKDVGFLSKEERECAKLLLTKPIFGINCHVRIGRKTIDFFPQEDDKLFKGMFVEYHPCHQRFDKRNETQYYLDRIRTIKNSKYKDVPLIHITSLKQLINDKRGEK